MGLFNNLFKKNYHKIDDDISCVDSNMDDNSYPVPLPDDDTFIKTDENETVILKNLGESFEFITLNRYGHITQKSLIYKDIISTYDLARFYHVPKFFSIRPGHYVYDVSIDSNGTRVLQVVDMTSKKAEELYEFIDRHMR